MSNSTAPTKNKCLSNIEFIVSISDSSTDDRERRKREKNKEKAGAMQYHSSLDVRQVEQSSPMYLTSGPTSTGSSSNLFSSTNFSTTNRQQFPHRRSYSSLSRFSSSSSYPMLNQFNLEDNVERKVSMDRTLSNSHEGKSGGDEGYSVKLSNRIICC